MALEGTLKELGLADILQLIYYQRKTGVLTVDGGFDRVRLLFYEGNIVFAESSKRGESRMGKLLMKKGLIKQEQLDTALKEQKTNGLRLGNILLRMGAISRDDIKDTLTNQFTELVSYVFTWRQGRYEFAPQGIPIDKDIPISLDTQHILMEGLRVLDEWSVVEGKITLDSIFTKTGASVPEALTDEEENVYGLVDSENDVSTISSISGLDNFQVSKVLLSLYEKGLVDRLKAPEEARAGVKERKKARAIPAGLIESVIAALFVISVLFFYFSGEAPRKTRQAEASESLDNLRFLIEVYKVEHGIYPEGLERIGSTTDPWGRSYVYKANAEGFTLSSAGPDGVAGTADDIH